MEVGLGEQGFGSSGWGWVRIAMFLMESSLQKPCCSIAGSCYFILDKISKAIVNSHCKHRMDYQMIINEFSYNLKRI